MENESEENQKMTNAIILAAGQGKRMKSNQAKCLQPVLGKPILRCITDNLRKAGIDRIVIVIGFEGDKIKEYFKDEVEYAWQRDQQGTGHAVRQAENLENLKDEQGKTIVINGDVPLVKAETFRRMLKAKDDCDLVLLSTIMEDPERYGRIIRDQNDDFIKIVETADCDEEEIKIKEINGAIYCFDNAKLWECLPLLKNNNKQGEYYLTDVIELFVEKGYKVRADIVKDPWEIMGVDHRMGQEIATKKLQEEINRKHQNNGVFLVDSSNIYIEEDVVIENDVTICPNVYLRGKTTIKSGAVIESGSVIVDSIIGENVRIENSRISDSKIGKGTTVGPYAQLRNNCEIGENCRIGNFVEMKKAIFGNGSKCAHLSYLGDCVVGEKVNIGCGVVFVNYDGKNKYQTIVEDGAFIGSNCNLIAPIRVGENALVAAGSTVNQDIPAAAMGIARARQVNKEGLGKKFKDK